MGMDDPVTVLSIAAGALSITVLLVVGWRRSRATDASGERIELVTSRYLGGKRVLTLIDVDGERLLLALSGNTVRLVARINSRSRSRPGPMSEGRWQERAQQTSQTSHTSRSDVRSAPEPEREAPVPGASEGALT
jgi:flagellar biogenesis protein FliO